MSGKKFKAITFSYDDGVTQDMRLIDMFNRYGLKATFNLNSERLGQCASFYRDGVDVSYVKPPAADVRKIYEGHEVAAHTLNHPLLTALPDEEVVRQVEQDRMNLSEIVGYEVVGFAYPGGGVNYNDHIADLIRKNTGVRYARTTQSSISFDLQADLYTFKPTVYHHEEMDRMFELGKRFIELEADSPQILYIWGHSYEFDIRDNWNQMEDFCKLISGRADIFYGTNREVLLEEYWNK